MIQHNDFPILIGLKCDCVAAINSMACNLMGPHSENSDAVNHVVRFECPSPEQTLRHTDLDSEPATARCVFPVGLDHAEINGKWLSVSPLDKMHTVAYDNVDVPLHRMD